MGRNVEPPLDIISQFRRLERRVENLERSQRISNTSIDEGSVVVNNGAVVSKHPNGVELLRAGVGETILPFDVDPTPGYVTRIRRGSGQTVFEVFTDTTGGESRVFIKDRNDNEILSEDWLVGRGLNRPFIPWEAKKVTDFTTPTDITTSGSFVGVYNIQGNYQHPALYVKIRVQADIGTAGEIRLQDNVLSTTMWSDTISSGFNGDKEGIGNISGLYTYGSNLGFEIQIRRTSGAGQIKTAMIMAYGQNAQTI